MSKELHNQRVTSRDKQDLLNYLQATLCEKEKLILRKLGFNDSEEVMKWLTERRNG